MFSSVRRSRSIKYFPCQIKISRLNSRSKVNNSINYITLVYYFLAKAGFDGAFRVLNFSFILVVCVRMILFAWSSLMRFFFYTVPCIVNFLILKQLFLCLVFRASFLLFVLYTVNKFANIFKVSLITFSALVFFFLICDLE